MQVLQLAGLFCSYFGLRLFSFGFELTDYFIDNMPVHSNPIGLENKTNGHTSTVNLRIKIPPSAVSHLETLAKKSIDNPLRKIGIVRVCVDGTVTFSQL